MSSGNVHWHFRRESMLPLSSGPKKMGGSMLLPVLFIIPLESMLLFKIRNYVACKSGKSPKISI
jgi:hypothetical protein